MAKASKTRGAAIPQDLTKANAAKTQKTQLRRETFVNEYLKDFNGAQAAIRCGYAVNTARVQASQILAEPRVQEMLAKAMVERAQRTKLDSDEVITRLTQIARADSRELSELYIGSCRYCWGKGNRYQRTPRELEEFRKEWDKNLAEKAAKKGVNPEELEDEFDDEGGIGFNPRKDPNPECPECFGSGEPRVVLKDTRNLSPEARLLFAGVKQTQHGIEMKQHNQVDQLVNLGKHHGLFRDKLEITGKDGKPLKAGVVVVPAKALPQQQLPPPRKADATEEPLKQLRKKFQIKARK